MTHERPTGPGRRGLATLVTTLLVVAGHAAVQTLLVLPDPVPGTTPAFVLLALASGVAVVLALTLLVAAVSQRRPGWRLLLRSLVLTLVAVLVSLPTPLLVPLVLVVGAPFLLAGRGAVAAVRRALGRSAFVLVASLVLAAVIWAAAVASGLFLGPVWGAPATWLGLGLAAAVVLRLWVGSVAVQSRGGGDRGRGPVLADRRRRRSASLL